jgi:hypothetical protein
MYQANMSARLTIALVVATAGAALLAPSTPAQHRGMRGNGGFSRSRPAFQHGGGERSERGGERSERGGERRLLDTSGLFYPGYYSADGEYDQEPEGPSGPPVQMAVMQPVPPPPPPPIEPLLMEKRNGEWVRVATGNRMATSPSAQSNSGKLAAPGSGIVEPAKGSAPVVALPPAVIVFRDGHQEEIAKYVIQGDALFTTMPGAAGVSRERKIPLSQVDLPASLKLNNERGAKFSLPSAPNEVVVRF